MNYLYILAAVHNSPGMLNVWCMGHMAHRIAMDAATYLSMAMWYHVKRLDTVGDSNNFSEKLHIKNL